MKSDEIIVNEVKMNPGSFAAAIKTGNQEGVLIGYEFEVCVPEKTLEKAKRPKQNIDYLEKINKAFKRTISFYDWYVKPRRGRWGLSISPRKFDSLLIVKPGVGKFKNFEEATKALLKRDDPDEDFSDLDYAVLMYEMFGVENATVETQIEKYFDIPDPKKLYKFLVDTGMYDEMGVTADPWGYDAEYKKSASVVASTLEKTMDASVVIFNDYHERPKNFDNWYIEPDGSLDPNDNDGAIEIVTPPMPAEQALTVLKSFYAMAKKLKLYTSSDNGTGLHINVSIPQTVDVLKLAVFLGDQYVLKLFEREDSEFAISALERLRSGAKPSIAYSQKRDRRRKNPANPGQVHQRSSINLQALAKLANNITSEHFSSISRGGDYISFRHSGGDYLNDYDSVLKVIGRFVQAMIIASDPEMYKKEYMTKLVKLIGSPQSQTGARLQDFNKVKQVIDSIKKHGLPVLEVDLLYKPKANTTDEIKHTIIQNVQMNSFGVFELFNTATCEIVPNSQSAKANLDGWYEDSEKLPKYYTAVFFPRQDVSTLEKMFNTSSLQKSLIFRRYALVGWGNDGYISTTVKFLPFTDAITQHFYKDLIRTVTNANKTSTHVIPVQESLQNPIFYFAYGMLTDPKYMFGADLVGVAELKNFEYKMYQFANVEPATGESVFGCLWAIDKEILSHLDKMEGYPTLYDRRTYPVYVNGEKYPAEVYVMTPNTLRSVQGTFPSKEYLKTVARGYINAGIPTEQIQAALYNAKLNEEFETGGSLGLPFPGTYEQEYGRYKSRGSHGITAMTNESDLEEEIAYHGTTDDITKFLPLTHFGTEKAAKDRMQFKKYKDGKIYKVDLNIKNPLTIKDFPGVHSPTQFAFELNRLKLISQQEMLSVTDSADIQTKTKTGIPFDQAYAEHTAKGAAALLRLMKKLGYDGFVYKNRYEDKGNISYVILDPRQVKILSVEPVTDEITEALDSSYPYTRSSTGKRYNFKTDAGIDYEVIFSGDRLVEISFFAGRKTGRGSTKLTGTGDSRRVLGTVINIILEYADIYSPIAFHFSAENDEPSRVKLYNALTDRVEQAMPEYEKLPPADLGSGTGFMLRRKDYPEIDIQLAEIE